MINSLIHRILLAALVLMSVIVFVQAENIPTAAGTDFYLSVFDTWMGVADQVPQGYSVMINATAETDVYVNSSNKYTKTLHLSANTRQEISLNGSVQALKGVHIQTTSPCYVNAFVHSGTSGAETVVLPLHLLGKQYMLQGWRGDLVDMNNTPIPHYSQFIIVGTATNTLVTITAKEALICVTTGATITAGQSAFFSVGEKEVLLFQPIDYSKEISGTFIDSDQPIAVFQGNNCTHIPSDMNGADPTWEQARPTKDWGKEFIIPGSQRLMELMFTITALDNNTTVEFYTGNTLYKTKTLQRGETEFGGENISGTGFGFEYVKANKPVCCYLYATGSTLNKGVGDPSMAEIVPVDNMATEARWGMMTHSTNAPYTASLLVITQDGNENNITLNGQNLSACYAQNGVAMDRYYGYVGYELSIDANGGYILRASEGGFSAHVLKLGKTSEAESFNVSLPSSLIIQCKDTIVCDTISQILWHDKLYPIANTLRDTLLNSSGFDSIYYVMNVQTEQCCRSNGMHGFSVSADRQVLFAPGNLQYNAGKGSHLCADGTTQQGVWRFAEHQWDYIGKANENASATYNGWIDLFGWGTSGWDGGAKAYQPWSTNTQRQDYIEAIPHDMTGEYRYRDWAVYNTIGDDAPETWRTLTKKELHFLLYYRDNAAELYGMATIHDTVGLVLLPDDFSFSSALPEFKAAKDLNNGTNVYTVEQWKQLEVEGAIFLPCVGQRTGMVYESTPLEFYWSATQEFEGNGGACCLLISVYKTQIGGSHLYYGLPVRPVFDIPEYYLPTLKIDTTVCDTLLPLTWRGHEWTEVDVIRDTLQSVCGTDRICLILSLNTEICCPNVIVQNYDTVVCDTLMPYRWCDTLFTESATFEIICKNNRGCDSLLYILHLDTFHCDRSYPLIVNKYNWQLLLDNIALQKLFPDKTARSFQWYKNDEPIPGATEDDYSEQNELHGCFQLRVELDNGQTIWSNILTIIATEAERLIETKVYNWQNLYLYRYEQGDKVWTEKRLMP